MPRIKQGDHKNLKFKRYLRSEMTSAERILWSKLRSRQFEGLKFRRQHGIGPYIVDFYCPDKLAVIEVDGDTHAFNKQIYRDKLRDEYLKSLGLQIIRYMNSDILRNIDGIYEDLSSKLLLISTSPNPSLQRRGSR